MLYYTFRFFYIWLLMIPIKATLENNWLTLNLHYYQQFLLTDFLSRMKMFLNRLLKVFPTQQRIYVLVCLICTPRLMPDKATQLKLKLPNVALSSKRYVLHFHNTFLWWNISLIHQQAAHNWWSPIATTRIFTNTAI